LAEGEAKVGSTPKEQTRTDADKMRRKAYSRWENEGGAVPCGPQVPGVAPNCEDEKAGNPPE
jgi:hypothetical protein